MNIQLINFNQIRHIFHVAYTHIFLVAVNYTSIAVTVLDTCAFRSDEGCEIYVAVAAAMC